MTIQTTCRLAGCTRLVSRAKLCRPHFITDALQWDLQADEIRQVPLGRLTRDELRALAEETRGATDIGGILTACIGIAPQAFHTDHKKDRPP